MREFIIKLVKLTIAILFLNFIVFLYVKEDFYSNYYFELHPRISNFLLADSHGEVFGRLDTFNVTNLSYKGDSYIDMYRKLVYFSQRSEKKIDTVYITIDAHCLNEYRMKSNNNFMSLKYETLQSSENFFEFIKNKFKYLMPMFSEDVSLYFFAKLKSKLKKPKRLDNEVKWVDMEEGERIKTSNIRFKTQFMSKEVNLVLNSYLKKIIDFCDTKKIVLIGVKFPLTNYYCRLSQSVDPNIEELFKANHLNVKDYSSFFIKSNIDDNPFFENQDHLNERGVRFFTEEIKLF